MQQGNDTTEVGLPDPVRVLHGTAIILAALLGFMGNILVIVSIATTPKLRTSHNALIVTLSVVDLLMSIFVIPFYSVGILSQGWPLSQAMCRFTIQFSFILSHVSLITLAVVATNRYMLISKPVEKYNRFCGRNKIVFMMVFMWSQGVVVFLISEFVLQVDIRYLPAFSGCVLNPHDTTSYRFITVLVCLVVVPVLLIMLVQYIRTFVVVRSSRQRVKPAKPAMAAVALNLAAANRPPYHDQNRRQETSSISKEEIRILQMSILLTFIYFFCYIPVSIIYVIGIYYPVLFRGGRLALFLMRLAPVINPVVYAWMNKNIREAGCQVIRCKWLPSRPPAVRQLSHE